MFLNQQSEDNFFNAINVISLILAYENLLENRQQSAYNDVHAANDEQAQFLLSEIDIRFKEQNAILEKQNKMLGRLLEMLEMEIPKPSDYVPMPECFLGCGCSIQPKERTDCYFYHEEHDMGARIPFCSYHNGSFGYCPCKDCDKFLSKSEASKVVWEYVSKRDSNK